MFVTVYRPQPQRPCCLVFLKGQCSVHCFLYCNTADAFRIAKELDFSIHGYADDLQIYDHCFVCDTQQLNDRLVHCIDCMGQWMRRNRFKQRGEDRVHLAGIMMSVVLPPVPSALSSSMEKMSSRHSRFSNWVSSLIRPYGLFIVR